MGVGAPLSLCALGPAAWESGPDYMNKLIPLFWHQLFGTDVLSRAGFRCLYCYTGAIVSPTRAYSYIHGLSHALFVVYKPPSCAYHFIQFRSLCCHHSLRQKVRTKAKILFCTHILAACCSKQLPIHKFKKSKTKKRQSQKKSKPIQVSLKLPKRGNL